MHGSSSGGGSTPVQDSRIIQQAVIVLSTGQGSRPASQACSLPANNAPPSLSFSSAQHCHTVGVGVAISGNSLMPVLPPAVATSSCGTTPPPPRVLALLHMLVPEDAPVRLLLLVIPCFLSLRFMTGLLQLCNAGTLSLTAWQSVCFKTGKFCVTLPGFPAEQNLYRHNISLLVTGIGSAIFQCHPSCIAAQAAFDAALAAGTVVVLRGP
ncbi:hypothetical protein A0H81_05903 [Grifola frondosa]|uniref:Uncharacterized protein n=1 Tax=Grifola frondosa TaxID=5627 RepID=A0A1C7MAL1_GRIFR|nr:hypothetical protein A0H81_05903 [Grifola frondosa]